MNSSSVKARLPDAATGRRRPKAYDPVDILVFLIPFLQFARLSVFGARYGAVTGVLNATDILMLAVFFYLALRGKLRIPTPAAKWSLILCLLWLASQCATDIVRRSAFMDYARGWSNVGLTVAGLAVLWTLIYGQPRRIMLYGWGFVLGSILVYFVSPTSAMVAEGEGDAWKFAFALPVTLAVFLFASSKQYRDNLAVILAVTIGMINMWLGDRNLGGESLAVAFYLVVMRAFRGKDGETVKLKAGTIVLLSTSIIVIIAGVLWIYGYAASAGILGDQAQQKYEDESSGAYGVILGGRPELLGELPAIYDSPILGHGSWAREPSYLIGMHEGMVALGYPTYRYIAPDILVEGQIPAHSYFFRAWVEAGVLGGVFWGWAFVMTARALTRVYPDTVELLPAMAFLAFLLLWNIPFSPYGTQERTLFPYTLITMMTCMAMVPAKVARVTVRETKRRIGPALAPRPQH